MKAERIRSPLTDASTVRVPARVPPWVMPTFKGALVIVDLALAFAAFAWAFYIREGALLIQQRLGAGPAWTRAFAPYGALLIVAGAFLYRGGLHSPFRAFSYARGVFVIDFLLALTAYALVRFMVRGGQMLARRHDLNLIPTLVVGRGGEAAAFIKEIRERPELGYRVIGV